MNAHELINELDPVRPMIRENTRVKEIAVTVEADLSMNLTNADSRALRHDVNIAPVHMRKRIRFNGNANMSISTSVMAILLRGKYRYFVWNNKAKFATFVYT